MLDDIEKAHPLVSPILLQVLDEGRLTDGQGHTVDFTNTVIILTSNLGAKHLLDSDGIENLAHASIMQEVRGHFKPAFLNRLSAIVIFDALGMEQLEKICQKCMSGVKRRLENQGINAILEQSGAFAVLQASYDRNYGARPVERYLEQTVVTRLSRMLLSGELFSGCTVHIVAEDVNDDSSPECKRQRSLQYRIDTSETGDSLNAGPNTPFPK